MGAGKMAVGKNKRLSKGKKGKGKKIVDPFTKKEWYDIKAPSNFTARSCGKTPVTRTTGTKIASEILKKTCYANSSQQKLIRKKMRDLMTQHATTCDLKELVNKFIPEVIGKEIEKACHGIYPMHNVHIRKVKMLKKPKFDITKLLEAHGDAGPAAVEDTGSKVKVGEEDKPPPGMGGADRGAVL